MTKRKLSGKQKAFIAEYLVDLNAKQAAIRAGYSKKTAAKIGSDNLARQCIQEGIAKAQKKREKRTEVTQDMVINELAKGGFYNIRDAYDENGYLLPIQLMPSAISSCIVGVKVSERWEGKGEHAEKIVTTEIKLMDKKGSLHLLGQHLGMFGQNVKVTAKVDHEHNHKHQHEVVPSTDSFIEQFIQSDQDSSPETPSKDGSLLPH